MIWENCNHGSDNAPFSQIGGLSARKRKALLTEAVNAYFGGEEAIGKAILKDFINATMEFEELAADVGIPSKSLHRMLGPHGNPSTGNFFAVLRALQKMIGVHSKCKPHDLARYCGAVLQTRLRDQSSARNQYSANASSG